MRAEYQRCAKDSAASTTASAAMTIAILTTTRTSPCRVISLTTRPASTGVRTPINASKTTITRKTARSIRYGRAKLSTRFQVPGGSCRSSTDASPCRIDRLNRIMFMECIDISTTSALSNDYMVTSISPASFSSCSIVGRLELAGGRTSRRQCWLGRLKG